ncbi:MAG: hypothetical protein K2O12_06990, partial [Muribaculaceae bacterium]|nr:hypothetical protein [Muribaculaceae bacterium]
DLEANTTIAEAKEAYWSSDRNYVSTVGVNQDGEHIVIKGRVCSSDEAGNVYKSFVIYDGTAALAVAVDTTKLYTLFAYGQEVVIDLTGMQIGGYNGLMQLGAEGAYNGLPSMTFMPTSTMKTHCFANGLAYPDQVDTALVTIPQVSDYKSTQQGLINWQSRLVRLDGVKFQDAGAVFAESGVSTNRYITDEAGNRLLVRNSGYATFASQQLPSGTGSVTGILSYYGTDWQLLLNDIDGCIGFDETEDPEDPDNPGDEAGSGDGSAESPFTVDQVLAGKTGSGIWLTGYIVGWVKDLGMDSSEFNAEDVTIQTNIIIAASADETDYTKCVPVQLPAGELRSALNLKDNPANYKKQIALKGNIESYFRVQGLKSPTAYAWGDKGEEAVTSAYTKVSAITSGKEYLIVASDGSAAAGTISATYEYGYLPVAEVTVSGNTAEAADGLCYTFEATTDGFYIKDALGRYLWMDETHNSYQVSAELPAEAAVWSVTANADGTFTVSNVARGKSMQYST